MVPGIVKENITTYGIDFQSLATGNMLHIGNCVLEITGPCDPCARMDEIRMGLQEELRGQRGWLCRVKEVGEVRRGDRIEVFAQGAENMVTNNMGRESIQVMTTNKQREVRVGVLMGSDTDLPVMSEAGKVLDKFGIGYEMEVMSAHRTPVRAHEYATTAQSRGLKVLIAAAGAAAHLAGVIAANTTLPVIGVPMGTSSLNGLDALLSTVQMPGGIPVATMAIDKAGAVNAAIFAARDSGLV